MPAFVTLTSGLAMHEIVDASTLMFAFWPFSSAKITAGFMSFAVVSVLATKFDWSTTSLLALTFMVPL